MNAEYITSRKNPLMTRIRRLTASRSYRREQGLFLGDGAKLLEEALKWDAPLETVVLTEGVDAPALPDGVRLVQVPGDVMTSISPMESPQGALFLCRTAETALPERLPGARYLVLDGVQDPGNVGTIWRTADALGADGLILVNGCADPWNPKTVRATMGACFRLPVYERNADGLAQWLGGQGIPLYATALREDNRPSPARRLALLRETFRSMDVSVEIRGALPEDQAVADAFAEIAVECVTNAVRHGYATHVQFHLFHNDCWRMTVTDNGISPAGPIREGGGIGGMRRRMARLGGSMELYTSPRFRIELSVPKEAELK